MNKKSVYWGCLFTIVLGSLVFILGLDRKNYNDYPVTVYQVYLNGQAIGIIQNEEELYNLIDKEQQSLKNEYKVDKIYAPIGLETTRVKTYEGKVDSVQDVYDKIKDVEPFTVKGYEITIAQSEDKTETINVLKKEDFDKAVENTIKAFVDEKEYEKYLASKQEKITTTGSIIENIKLMENITVKEKYLSTESNIFTDANELSKYMLFGTTKAQETHTVKAGETIPQIADAYELNTQEFLIVNPEIISENALLFTGQEVNIGLINPKVRVVVENTLVEDKEIAYKQEVKYDNKWQAGTSYKEQVGQNGLQRVTYYTETINGVTTQVERKKEEELVPTVNEVIVKGGNTNIGERSGWSWPTLPTYHLTSYFGWRTDPVYGDRAFHRGIDIAGTGYGSPIFAAKSGVIIQIGYMKDMGNYIMVDHKDGYVSGYLHLKSFSPGMRVGVEVTRGQEIGQMGSTGKSTGTHLDFRVKWQGDWIDPLRLQYN